MDKFELAQYLVNLHTLMEAQDKTAIGKSTTLVDEYNLVWAQLKQAIKDEVTND